MRRTATALLVLLLTLPFATSQTEPVQPSVELSIEVVEEGASIDAPATYTVTVRNTSPGSASGEDPPMDVTLEVSDEPQGWQASLDRAAFQIPPGGEEETTLTVGVSASAESPSATITVTATIRNGAFPPLQQEAQAQTTVDVPRDDTARREAAEIFGDYLWIIVLGGIALYVASTILLILLFRKRGPKEGDENTGGDEPFRG